MYQWHLITGEYPPQIGGVSDYTYLVASGLAAAGDEVHVWAPLSSGEPPSSPGVIVHRQLGDFTSGDLRRVGEMLNEFPQPRRLLVQWVPHSYGYKSLNLPFCLWLWNRAARNRDYIELMVHEPFLAFGEGSRKQDAAAIVHRIMTMVLLRAASRVWVSIPNWERLLRPYLFGRRARFCCLPVPSNVPVIDDPVGVSLIRARYARDRFLITHFGTYGREVAKLLMKTLPVLLSGESSTAVLLLGWDSERMRDEVLCEHPEMDGRLYATGPLAPPEISRHLSACDVMFQPYTDGVNGRHGGLMAGLSHGLPIVSTIGHLTESFWVKSGSVSLVPVENVTEMVELTLRLLEEPAERLRLGAAAAALYQERFDVGHTIDALRDATNQVGGVTGADCNC